MVELKPMGAWMEQSLGCCRAQALGSGQGTDWGSVRPEWAFVISVCARKQSRVLATPVSLSEHKNIFHSQTLSSTGLGALPEDLGWCWGRRKGLARVDVG